MDDNNKEIYNLDINKDKNKEEIKKSKLNYIDKLFIRIFLSSLLLLSMVITNNVRVKKLINSEINFLSYARIFNGLFNGFIPISDELVYNVNIYDNVIYDSKLKSNEIHNYTTNYVQVLTEGVVTKIYKNKNGLYDITIKSIDGYNYIYQGLESLDISIYSYITSDKIVGLAKYDEENNCYKFNLLIEKDGEYFSFYENAQD